MRIILKNEYGQIEIGGANHPVARLQNIEGLGLLSKSYETINFTGVPGSMFDKVTDNVRLITMLFDFFGDPTMVERLYLICNYPVEIIFITPYMRRKITGRVFSEAEIESIVYHRWQSIALQFSCENPYFTDLIPIRIPLFAQTDHFPNTAVDGEWKVSLPAVATSSKMSGIVKNIGGTILYPTILITNLGEKRTAQTEICIKNITTGAEINIAHTMGKNETVTVDLDRRKILSGLDDITNKISNDTVLSDFYLKIGENEVNVTGVGAEINLYALCEYSNTYISVVI